MDNINVISMNENKDEDLFYVELGAKMRRARLLAGKTQAQIGQDLFVTMNTVYHFERGTMRPRAYYLKLFCEETGVEPNYLMGYEGKQESETDMSIRAKLRGMTEEDKERLLAVLDILFPRE